MTFLQNGCEKQRPKPCGLSGSRGYWRTHQVLHWLRSSNSNLGVFKTLMLWIFYKECLVLCTIVLSHIFTMSNSKIYMQVVISWNCEHWVNIVVNKVHACLEKIWIFWEDGRNSLPTEKDFPEILRYFLIQNLCKILWQGASSMQLFSRSESTQNCNNLYFLSYQPTHSFSFLLLISQWFSLGCHHSQSIIVPHTCIHPHPHKLTFSTTL